jgi:hypothetical protein
VQVRLEAKEHTLLYHFAVETGDREAIRGADGRPKARFLGGTVHYHLPREWRLDETHPDLLGAVAVALAGDFAGQRLNLSWPVSDSFREHLAAVYKWTIAPVDPRLKPRQWTGPGRMGLCFSGGVDSTAALSLVPANAVLVFLDRVDPPSALRGSMYDKDAPLRACKVLREIGREVWPISTDAEYLREPVGFMNDLAMSTPLMLLADWLHVDATAYGLILESSYLNKGHKFREYAQTRHWRQYGTVAAAVGIPWNLITAGLSEVVTTRLVMESPLQHVAQSCIRGPFGAPCLNCWKCFRKSLLEATLAGDHLRPELLDQYFAIHEAQKKLEEVPIKHEDVMMFILQRYRDRHPAMSALRDRLRADDADLTWMERWFHPAREVLTAKYAAECEANIARVVQPMTADNIQSVRDWDRMAAAEVAGRTVSAH